MSGFLPLEPDINIGMTSRPTSSCANAEKQYKGLRSIIISWVLYGIAIVVLSLRLLTQSLVVHSLGWGDAFMVAALLSGLASLIVLNVAFHTGFGRHVYYLSNIERINATRLSFIGQPLGIASSTFGRISFMILMFQLFGTTKIRRYSLVFMMLQTAVINFGECILIFVQCENAKTLWDPVGFPSRCMSFRVQEYTGLFQASCNSATDLILTMIPAFVFRRLNMTLRTRIGLIALLGSSIFAFVASLIKVILLKSLGDRGDYTFNTVDFLTWQNVENTLVIISASIPQIRPLFTRKLRKERTRQPKTPSYKLSKLSSRSKTLRTLTTTASTTIVGSPGYEQIDSPPPSRARLRSEHLPPEIPNPALVYVQRHIQQEPQPPAGRRSLVVGWDTTPPPVQNLELGHAHDYMLEWRLPPAYLGRRGAGQGNGGGLGQDMV